MLRQIPLTGDVTVGGVPRPLIPFIATRITECDPPSADPRGSFIVLDASLPRDTLGRQKIVLLNEEAEISPEILRFLENGGVVAGKAVLLSATVIDPKLTQAPLLAIAVGQTITAESLVKFLSGDGYERGVNLYLLGDRLLLPEGITIEFFGNTIDAIRVNEANLHSYEFKRRKASGQTPLHQYIGRIFTNSEANLGSIKPKSHTITFDYASPVYHLGLRLPPRLANNPTLTRHFLDRQRAEGRTTYIASRLDQPFENTQTLDLLPGPGFISSLTNEVLLTEAELSTDNRQERAIQRLSREEIDTGMLVTHIDHGIGKLGDVRTREIDGVQKEYVSVEYAEGDRLLVPLEQLHRLTKYIGSPDPAIYRLSGPQWQTAVEKLKERSREMALELLNLYAAREVVRGQAIKPNEADEATLVSEFPHTETPDQERAIQEVYKDLSRERPMDRLICGDVGFGKTEVALRAAYRAILAGYQVAILAPTTILAEQHYATAVQRMAEHGVRVEALSRFRTGGEQTQILRKLKDGEVDLIVGTHRLLSEDVIFKNLGLLVIDEEQRFGVEQKEKLKHLRTHINVLTMSATPIPRTLNMALSSLRDISLIETPPQGRRPITTRLAAFDEETIADAIKMEVDRHGQVFYLSNDVKHIAEVTRRLQKLLPEVRFGVGHGQMAENQLAHVMGEFAAGEVDVLVCSTIIENGLDIPNANTILIDHATHFGLSQLYQLRGRVGRSDREAFCYLLYRQGELTADAEKRLDALLDNTQIGAGYSIALRDLEIRGMGNILGREQSGQAERVGLSLYIKLLQEAQEEIRSGRKLRLSEPIIDLPLSTAIPKELTPSTRKRFALYREIDSIGNEEQLAEVRQSLVERYDTLIPELENLLYVAHLRLLARQTTIQSIKWQNIAGPGTAKHRVEIVFEENVTEELLNAVRQNHPWTRKDNRLHLRIDSSADWQQILLDTLQLVTEGI